MLLFVEGLSKSGKSLLIKRYLEKHPGITFKGAGQIIVGIDERWKDYNYWMHNIMERLDFLNNYKMPILWDRGISEAVYADRKWSRLSKVHHKKAVIFIDVPFETLKERGSLESNEEFSKNLSHYREVISSFDVINIELAKFKDDKCYITDAVIKYLNKEVEERMKKDELCPKV